MNKKLKQKGLNEYKIIIPMSDETVKSIKANAAKTILGASIAGFMMFGGQSAKAESVSEPQAIIQTAETQNEVEKKELYLEIDKLMSFNKAARVENDEQKFAERKIQNANTASVDLEENLHQSSVRDEVSADAVIETTSIAEKGQSESNDEILSAISKKETDEESVLNNAENKKDFEAEIAAVASIDGKEAETKTEISKASEESDVKKAASSEDDKNLETVSGAEAEENIEEKVQTDEANETIKETITEDKTEETSEVQSGEEKTHPEEAGQTEKNGEKSELSLDDFTNNNGIEDLFDIDKISEAEEKPEVTEEKTPDAQKAPEEANEPNYSDDEAKIEDYDKDNDYKKTDLEQGDTTQVLNKDDAGKEAKDGFKFETSNPSATSESLTEYGYAIVIDKKTGQRTYTLLYVTDTGRIAVKTGDKPMMEEGDKLHDGSPEVTYKPNEDASLTESGRQKNYNWHASEETLEHINNSGYTVIGMKDDYDQDNPKIKFFEGTSFQVVYKVNPWSNENDKLELMELSGEYRDKVFVQGQDINTGVKVDNMDENAKERIVGQVYNPVTGEVVPGASAYIDDDGNVHIKMPEGALKKDENGNYVVNEDSIFNTDNYKALQNLDVKFFARPRTKDEFTTIAQTDEYTPGTYVGTEAGEGVINHKGEDVTIDKQGIDRYDHYNLIGTLKIDLDDTRYYNQNFKDGNKDDTSDITSSAVKPGVKFDVGIYEKDETDEFEKSADDMNGAKSRGEAVGVLKMDFIDKLNEGKAEEDQWKVIVDPDDISNFSIIAPKSAKAGDFAAIPVEYTYTNGSKDVHWFHFVVQETDNNLPSYNVQVDYPSEEMDSTVTVEQNDKKNKPNKYTIDSNTYKDDQGNIWDVTINEATGEVTAKPQAKPDGKTFNGGEKLQVPVTVHYENTDETETAFAEFVLKEKSNIEPDYDAKAGKAGDKLESNVIVDDNNYDRKPVKYTLDETTYTDNKGNTWIVSIDENTGKVTATVPNAAEGETIDLDGTMINVPVTAHYVDADGKEIGTKKANVQFLGSGTQGTHEYTEKIPFDYTIEYDPNFYEKYPDAENNYKVVTEGKDGTKKTKLTIKDSKVVKEEEVEKTDPVNAVIKVGDKNYTGEIKHKEKIETPFEVEYQYSDELEAGETKVIQKGEKGSYDLEYSQKIKNGQADGDAKTEKTNVVDSKKEIIVIGIKPVEKVVEKGYNTVYEYDENLEAGKMEEKTLGKNGKTTITTSYDKENNKLVTEENTENPIDRVVRIGIKPIEKETELPFETEYVYDENMEAGKTEVTQEGKTGTAKITTYFNKETGKLETKIEREEPTKKIVKYGSKTEGKVVVESEKAYEIEIIEDPEMEAGKTEVIQEGKNGKVETTITIENSKEVGRDTMVVEEPTKKIIKVGTKNVCDIPEQPDKPEEPDTPDKPEGPDEPDKPNEPGKEEPGTPDKPEEPSTPDKPEEPSTPDKPTVPDEPSVPGEPSVPETPNEPNGGGTTVTEEKPSEKEEAPEEESEKPEEKVEEKAEDSDVESKEDKVDETEEVVEDNIKTSKGNNESDGANGNKRLPKTGDGVNRSLYAYMMGLMGSAMMAIGVKKKNKESLDEE